MQKITLPQNIIFAKGEQLNEKKVIIEPCYPGYGVTIGNSLRRVLLSSLPGAAVIGVKIKGVTHEFTTIPFVKEDVLEILLNFKKLRLKVYSDEVIKLNLSVNGEKVVKAGDITKNSQVEIINPDLILASITDIKGSLDMEIYAAKGVGYETIESRENKNNEIGYIEIDSIFTSVLSVSVDIENVRVGKMTNWEKLNIKILTDGTITAEEAFKKSVVILIDQFNALIAEKEEVKKEEKEEKTEKKGKPDEAIFDKEEDKPAKKKRGRPKKEKTVIES